MDDNPASNAPPLTKATAFWYAMLLTALFFAVGQINLFNLSGSFLNDKFFQVLHALWEYEAPRDGPPDTSVPLVMLFSDTAAQLDNYGWPPKLMDLYDIVEEAYMAHAEAVYVDLVIRSANHDPIGFCQMIEDIAELRGEGHVAPLILPGNPGTTCLQDTSKLVSYALQKEFHPDRKAEYYGLTADQDIRTPIIFSAPLEYLKARDNYYRYPNSTATKKEFESAIHNWPGIAYLDQVALLAPNEVSTKDGRGSYIWVDKDNYYSPAYIMACLEKKRLSSKTDHPQAAPCAPKENAQENSTSDLYLLWHGGYRGWNSLGTARGMLQSQYISCGTNQEEQLLWQLLSHITPVVSADKKQVRCPYYPTIDLANYVKRRIPGSTLKSVLRHRNVLIGTDMSRFNDYIYSPVQGEVPGIYAHATSLDDQVQGLKYQAADESSGRGRATAKLLLLIKYGLFTLICWGFLVYKEVCFKYIVAHKTLLTRSFILLILLAILLLASKPIESDSGLPDIMAVVILLVFSLYAFLITFFPPEVKQPPHRQEAQERLYQHFRNQKEGLELFAPHLMIIIVTFAVLAVLGNLTAIACKIAPPDFISVFISLIPLYLMAGRDSIGTGLAQFLGNKDVANTLLD